MRTNENQTYVIPVVNRKGGVAKTTTAEEVAYILATSCEKRVLLIDADSQANLTWQITDKRLQRGGVAALLRRDVTDYRKVVMHTDVPRLDIIPASRDLGRLDLEILVGRFKVDFLVLQRVCADIKANGDYDFVIIDCPPYYSASCVNAIGAATASSSPPTPTTTPSWESMRWSRKSAPSGTSAPTPKCWAVWSPAGSAAPLMRTRWSTCGLSAMSLCSRR